MPESLVQNVTVLRGNPATSSPAPYNVTSFLTSQNVSSTDRDNCEVAQSCSNIRFDPESSTIVSEWGLICDKSWLGTLIISIQMIGVTIGSFLAAMLGERFGRKLSLYLWLGLGVVFNIVAVFSINWQMFAVIRFFIGISVGGNLSTSQVYALEFVTAKWRVFLTGLPTWNLSAFLFGVCVFLLKDWRHAHIATAILSAISFLTVFWVPESLRWLAIQGKEKKARQVATKICTTNRRPTPDPNAINFAASEGKQEDKKATLVQLFRSDLRKRTIVCGIVFFFMSVMYYAIGFGIKALYGNFYINFILYSVIALPLAPLAPILGHKLGRRLGSVILLGCAGLVSFSVAVVFFTTTGSIRGYVITALAIIISVLLDHAWSILISFIAELFPTSVRVLSFGSIFTAARIGGIVAPFLIPRDFSILYVSYVVMGVLTVINICLVLCMPETKDSGLEDVLGGKNHYDMDTGVDEESYPMKEEKQLV